MFPWSGTNVLLAVSLWLRTWNIDSGRTCLPKYCPPWAGKRHRTMGLYPLGACSKAPLSQADPISKLRSWGFPGARQPQMPSQPQLFNSWFHTMVIVHLCPSVFDVRKQTPEIGRKWCYSCLFPRCAFWKALTEWIPLPGLRGSRPWISLEENYLLSNIKDVENGAGHECLLWHFLY